MMGGGGDDDDDAYNFDMGGGDAFGGFGQSDSFEDKPRRPARKPAPERPSGGRVTQPTPLASDVGTKTFREASASDVLAKAQAMLDRTGTGSGQKARPPKPPPRSRSSRSPSMDADGIMANLSSSEDGSPKKASLRRLDTQSFDPDDSFADDVEDDNDETVRPRPATSPVDHPNAQILNTNVARQSAYGVVRDASDLVHEEVPEEDGLIEEVPNPPLTATAKAQFTSSIHGNVRSITDLPSRLGAPPTRSQESFDFGAHLESPRNAPAAAPAHSPQKIGKTRLRKPRRQVSFDAAHVSNDDAVRLRASDENEEPLEESVDEASERSPALSGRPFASNDSEEFLRESLDDETYSEEFPETSSWASPRASAGPPLSPRVEGPPASLAMPPPVQAPRAAPYVPPAPATLVIVADDLPCGVDFTVRLDKVPLLDLDGSVTRLVEEDIARALGVPRRVVAVASARESLAGPQSSVLECRINVKDGASARRLGEVLVKAPPILLRRDAPDFSSCRYLDRVRVRDDPRPGSVPTAYPFGEATKIRGPASGAQPVRLLVYDEGEDENEDVDEAQGALQLVRTREVATQFGGNDASIQTAYVPTAMRNAAPAYAAAATTPDAALHELGGAGLFDAPPPPLPYAFAPYGYPQYGVAPVPPPMVREARAEFDQMLNDQRKLHDMLAQVRTELKKAHADVMAAVPTPALGTAALLEGQPRPPDLPVWKAFMDVDPALTEREARDLAFEEVKGKGASSMGDVGTGPAGATAETAGGPRE